MTTDASLLCHELIRIGTYVGWPSQDLQGKGNVKPSVVDLARAGFYFTGRGDFVRCFACGIQIGDWERHHEPYVVHATRNPQCPLVMKANSGNRPVYIPPAREYAAIMSMLNEAGKVVAATKKGTSYSSSSLLSNTLTSLYGESMICSAAQSNGTHAPPLTRSHSNSPRLSHSTSITHSPVVVRLPVIPRQNSLSANTPPPPRRSSTTDSSESMTFDTLRPHIQRARSYAADPSSERNSETIANRQNSNPGFDHAEFQESEEARFKTFNGWAGIRGATAREFAQAGFIYIGPPDRVQCAFCSGILRNWNDDDSPLEEHRKHFPQCPFVVESLSAITLPRPKHSKFRSEPSRLSSYRGWNMNRNPKPAELAKAGFFYVGHGDSVKCFFCDGGLRNWEPDDDPWREHARWFPKCAYVKQSKGQAFIDGVLNDTNLAEYQTASLDETQPKHVARPPVREVDPREVTARMDSAIVKKVLSMDVPKKMVKKAIRKRLAENGEDFTSAEALLEAVFRDSEDAPKASLSDLANRDQSASASGDGESPDSMRLAEENRQLKEQKLCKICMDEEVCVAFIPCGHLVSCSTCAPALNQCPICRAKIRGTIRTYMS
ncbi:unnamed protein product [Candidula unifasciata]|uniref:RING-type domain-containing protein n=1 Tax=Candidula unifasciata TaxID=100452 RepID=A0A8S3ZMT9_9EUPU|nr:unnamed protein product [Candidula unifasciata]